MSDPVPLDDFWNSADLLGRIRHKQVRTRDYGVVDKGYQVRLDFVNGYSMSVINDGGLGVETMIMTTHDDEAVVDDAVPHMALKFILQRLRHDTIIAFLTPEELRDVLLDVAYWPDYRGIAEMQRTAEIES